MISISLEAMLARKETLPKKVKQRKRMPEQKKNLKKVEANSKTSKLNND